MSPVRASRILSRKSRGRTRRARGQEGGYRGAGVPWASTPTGRVRASLFQAPNVAHILDIHGQLASGELGDTPPPDIDVDYGSFTWAGWGDAAGCYTVRVSELGEALPASDPGQAESAAVINRAMERLIRQRPQQYLWGYNRYKTPRSGH